MFIDAIIKYIGILKDDTAIYISNAYPTCVISLHSVTHFSTFVVRVQRQDEVDELINLNLIFHILILAPATIRRIVICNPCPNDGMSDILSSN